MPNLPHAPRKTSRRIPRSEVIQGDGALAPFDAADVIYVNAGCTRPAESWLDRLADGGRLILPMTSDKGFRLARSDGDGKRRRGVSDHAAW